MRKMLIGVLVGLLLLVSVGSVSATRLEVVYEQDQIKSIVFPIGEARFFINDQVPGYTMDVKSFVVPGYNRTVVPVRFLANALGVSDENIDWIQEGQRVILSQPGMPAVEMVYGDKFMTIDGVRVDTFGTGASAVMDIAPFGKAIPGGGGRTFLPARFVAYALGFDVAWDQGLDLAIIWPKGAAQPDVQVIKETLKQERGIVTMDRETARKTGDIEGQLAFLPDDVVTIVRRELAKLSVASEERMEDGIIFFGKDYEMEEAVIFAREFLIASATFDYSSEESMARWVESITPFRRGDIEFGGIRTSDYVIPTVTERKLVHDNYVFVDEFNIEIVEGRFFVQGVVYNMFNSTVYKAWVSIAVDPLLPTELAISSWDFEEVK